MKININGYDITATTEEIKTLLNNNNNAKQIPQQQSSQELWKELETKQLAKWPPTTTK